jgi:hypothetical protein
MSRALSTSAERLGCSERTLRRYVNDGLLRGRRVARRQLELPLVEETYLASHWGLLRAALARPVDIVGLEQAETMPTLLADIVGEGRVLVDRDGVWDRLLERRADIFASAAREEQATARRARETVAAARERIAAAS